MGHQFQSLGELSGYLDTREHGAGITVVDPPISLIDATDLVSRNVWKSQPSVRKVVDFIARQLASTPLHHYQRISDTERERLSDGDIAQLLAKPCQAPRLTPYRFWHSLLVDRLVYDRYCALITRADGRPWLTRIPARRVRFETDALDQVTKIIVHRKDGGRWELAPEKCIFDAGYSTSGGNGTSPMDTLKDILLEDSESVRWRADVFRNGARFPGWIERPNQWPADGKARDRFTRGWAAFKASGGRAGETPVLEDGMKYHPMDSFRPKDLELMSARQLTDITVASAYHIAPELVGAREGNFSNVDAYRQMLYGPSLGPYFTEWEQIVNDAFATADSYVEAHIDAKLRGSFLEQARHTSTATGGPWMTRNEARAMRNLPPVDGGDELITPLNVLVGGQASPHDSGTQNLDGEDL